MTEGEEANFLHAIRVYFPCMSYGYFPVDPSAVLPSRLVKTSRVGGFRSTERERIFASSRLLCLIRQPINSPMTSGTSSPGALTPSSCAENRKDYLHIALKVVRSHTHETEELTWSKGIGLLGNI